MSVSIGKLLLPNATSRVLLTSVLAGSLAFAGCGPDDGNNGGADTGADVQMDTGDAGMDTGDTESDGDAGEVEEGDPAALAIAPGLQDFGTVTVGETSSTASFTLTNEGDLDSTPLGVELEGSNSSDFTVSSDDCDGVTLAGGDTCTVDVTFEPSTAGNLSADLVVSATDGGEVTATLEGTGAEPGALELSPTPVDFGSIVVDQTSDATEFTVENTGGSSTGDLSVTLSGGSSTAFNVSDDGCSDSPLDAGSTCTVSVEFAPASTGAKSTTLVVSDAASDDDATAELSGTAVQDADLKLSPLAQDFGSVVRDESSSSVTFTVENDGGVDTGTLSVNLTGTDSAAFKKGADACDTQTLAPGDDCTIALTFEPASAGDKSAALEITGTPGGTVTANLTGEGVEPGALKITPTLADFGAATVNTVGSTETFTIENTGGAPTGTLTTGISGSHAADFSPVNGGNACQGISLSAGATCTIAIVFEPNATGARSASLTVSDTTGGSVSASLSGEGLAVQDPAQIVVRPSAQDFGSVPINTNSTEVTFEVENIGDLTSGTPTAGLTGTNFNQFDIVSDTCSSGLDGGNTCEITVRFEPTSTGSKSAVLEVDASPGGSDTAQLQGMGTDTSFQVQQNSPSSVNWTGASGEEPPVVNGGTSNPVTITLVNTSAATATTGSISLDLPASSPFGVVNDNCSNTTLAAGTTCTFDVEFSPSSVGDGQSATLEASASPGGTISIALQGNSLPEFSVADPTDDPFAFPDTPLGDSQAQEFQITNTDGVGAVDRDLDASLSGANTGQFSLDFTGVSGDPCDGTNTVAPGASCYVNVVFEPTGTPGNFAASLDVTDGTVTKSVGLEGTGLGPIQFLDDTVEVGPITVDTTTTSSFTIQNTASQDSGRLAVDFTGNDAFAITTDRCDGRVLAGNSDCTIDVVFFPTSAGTFSGTLSVAESGGQTIQGTITGEATSASDLDVTAGNGDFGTLVYGDTDTETFTVTNVGGEDSGNLGTGASLSNTGLFTIDSDGCENTVLSPTDTCDVTVSVDTTAVSVVGSHSYTLNLPDSNEVTLRVVVDPALSISPNPAQFGDVVTGEASSSPIDFTVTNDSSATVTIDSTTLADDFNIVGTNGCSGDLAGGASCSLSVEFAPDSASDDYTATNSAKLEIDGTGGEIDDAVADLYANALAPADLSFTTVPNLEFGFAVVGSTGATRTFTVENTGEAQSQTLSVNATEVADWSFSGGNCDGSTLAPAATCDVEVTFAPDISTATGTAVTSDISVTDGAGASTGTETVSGTPIADNKLDVSPTEHTFSDTLVGDNDTFSFTVTNSSATPTSTEVTASATSSHFAVTSNGCPSGAPLQPSSSCTIEVAFAPTSPNSSDSTDLKQGTLTVEAGPSGSGYIGRAALFGTAISDTAPDVQNPSDVDFGDIGTGDSVTETITLVNNGDNASGGVTATLTSGVNESWFAIASNGCSSGVPALGSCDIDVTFSPQAITDTANVGLELDVNGGNTFTVNLTGDGVAPAKLEWTVTSGWLASNEDDIVATTESIGVWTLQNTGAATSGEITIDLGSSAPFELDYSTVSNPRCVDSNGNGISLQQGESCDVGIKFNPQLVGSFSTSVEATAAPGGTATDSVEGDATPTLSAAPAQYNQCIETGTSQTQTFDITNVGPESTGFLTVDFTGSDEFYLESSTCSGDTLGTSSPGNSCTVTVVFAPTTTGTGKTATLTVRDVTDGTGNDEATVDLTGQGVTDTSNCP